jgi:hypothetical protein
MDGGDGQDGQDGGDGGDGQDGEVAELARRLDALRVPADGATVEAARALLAERAPLLERVARLDPQRLALADRRRLAAALERAKAHDAELVGAITRAKEEAKAALDALVGARGAVRGYRGAGPSARPGSVLRTA